jgi:hypothetical protein
MRREIGRNTLSSNHTRSPPLYNPLNIVSTSSTPTSDPMRQVQTIQTNLLTQESTKASSFLTPPSEKLGLFTTPANNIIQSQSLHSTQSRHRHIGYIGFNEFLKHESNPLSSFHPFTFSPPELNPNTSLATRTITSENYGDSGSKPKFSFGARSFAHINHETPTSSIFNARKNHNGNQGI